MLKTLLLKKMKNDPKEKIVLKAVVDGAYSNKIMYIFMWSLLLRRHLSEHLLPLMDLH